MTSVEFIAATIEAQVFLREEHLRNAFSMFDTDNSGKIDAREIIALISGDDAAIDEILDREEVEAVIKEVDVDGDGEVDFEEFILMMRNMVTPR